MKDRRDYFNNSGSSNYNLDENGAVPLSGRQGMSSPNATTYTMPQVNQEIMRGNGNNTMPTQGDPVETTENASSGTITTPPQSDFDNPAFQGSMQQILSENLGQFVVIEFLIGTQAMTEKMGILYSVGRGFVVLYEELQNRYVVCDIFSIKFVTFYEPGQRPRGYNGNSQFTTTVRNGGKRLV